jgi:pentatricopeptide repeat protein
MHKIEVELFITALNDAKGEFYVDSIHNFKKLINEFPDSELCDDALYNIGLCYFELKQFSNAIETFEKVINYYPESTISILEGGNEFGKTIAKSSYGLVNCYLAIGNVDKASMIYDLMLEHKDSYITTDEKKITFKELTLNRINLYINSIK